MELRFYKGWREFTLLNNPKKIWRAYEIRDELNDVFGEKKFGEPWNLRDIQQYIKYGRIPECYDGGWKIIPVERMKSRWLKYKGLRQYRLEKII